MLRKVWFSALALLAIIALGLVAACGDDDDDGGSAEDKAAVEQAVTEVASYSGEDIDAFLERVTPNFIESFTGFNEEECRANADECVGEPAEGVTFENTSVDGDKATTEATFADGEDSISFKIALINEDDRWKVDTLGPVSQDIPEGVKEVSLTTTEFEFGFDAGDIPDDGNFAFAVENEGEQVHEAIVVNIPEDLDLEEAVASQEEPEGVTDVGFFGPLPPGDSGNLVFEAPLEPGRYAILCFLPDSEGEEGTAHAELGMYTEFTIE